MPSAPANPLPPSDAEAIFSECLANARLTALRALLETVNTTDDPIERRRAATAILRISDPNAPRPRVPRLSEPGSAHAPAHSAPPASNMSRYSDAGASADSEPRYEATHRRASDQTSASDPDPETAKNIAAMLAQVAAEEDFLENDDEFIDSVADLPDISRPNLRKSAAKLLAEAAGKSAKHRQPNRHDPPS
jgi:hypothetical protein